MSSFHDADRLSALRIIDACSNRAMEGLRTMEEYVRFRLQDPFLTESIKQLRHDLRLSLASVSTFDRWAARSVTTDCGTSIETTTERKRSHCEDVAQAAASRTLESLRCIEEYGKVLAVPDSRAIEALRYRLYTLASTICLLPHRSEQLREAKLYLLMPCEHSVERFAVHVEALFNAGVDIIQLRDKSADDSLIYACAKQAAAIARRLGKWFIVNDRADIAAASHASGVHVGQEELPVEAIRRIMGQQAIVGVSTHSLDQARAAVLDGADYIGCGPTFPSQTKPFQAFPGLEFLTQVSAEITLPAYAIGGINAQNINKVIHTKIHGIALSDAILGRAREGDLSRACEAARELKQAISPFVS